MTIKECIDAVDNIKPNQYSIREKVQWLSFIDEIIINDVLRTHEGYDGRYDNFEGYSENKLSESLIVGSPYDRLYTAYLKMKIDEENGETAKYNNSAAMFNAYMMEYRKHYNKTHMPLDVTKKNHPLPQNKKPSNISDAVYENIKRELYALLSENFADMVSDDKIYDIVMRFVNNNIELLKGKDGQDGVDGEDGKDGADGKDGYTPVKGVDYYDGELGQNYVDENGNIRGEIFNDYENNKALSENSHAEGYSTISGIKGYYYSDIDFYGEFPIITLTKEQGVTPTEPFTINYTEGDIISLVSGAKYYNCATIKEVNNNIITVYSLPITDVIWGTDVDDNSIYVIAKPTDGYCSLGSYAHAEGDRTQALEMASHAEGRETLAYGQYSHAEGRGTKAAYASHAEGLYSDASAFYAHAEGGHTKASGDYSHAEGNYTESSGEASHTEGYDAKASGKCSHAEGNDTKAIGESSHAEGNYTTASGFCSHSEGYDTTASGNCSHAEGFHTEARGSCQHVRGKYNVVDTEDKYADVVGNGEDTTDDKRSNAYTLDWDGNAWYQGNVEASAIILRSSKPGSTKKFKITIDDNGTLSTTAI